MVCCLTHVALVGKAVARRGWGVVRAKRLGEGWVRRFFVLTSWLIEVFDLLLAPQECKVFLKPELTF